MAVPRYITLAGGNRLSLQDLVTQIVYVIEEGGIGSLRIKDTLQFYDDVNGIVGGLKYDQTLDAVVYSTDGGASWNPLTSDTFWWTTGKTYTTGTLVLHESGWYVCQRETTDEPGVSASWGLLTAGSLIKYVRNSEQLKVALESNATNLMIVLSGDISTDCAASITANTVSIWSDEASRVYSNITFSTAAGTTVYWHTNGTRVTGNCQINSTPGRCYIDRLNVTYGTLVLGTGCYYQRIDGQFSGGTKELWNTPSLDAYLEKDLSKLAELAYTDNLKVYVNSVSSNGYITVSAISQNAAKYAFQYFKIHSAAPLTQRPETAPAGYVFYASDTGDLYIMDEEGQWGPAIHFRGPQGLPGADGNNGYTFIPTVSRAGEISWEVRLVPITETGPSAPTVRNIKGPAGASAFDIWKESTGNINATEDDYLKALGVGSRKTLFTAVDVNQAHKVLIKEDYPVVGIEDNDGYHWILPSKAVLYVPPYVYIDITSILEARDMLAQDAFITAFGGTHYVRAPIHDTVDSTTEQSLYGWESQTDTEPSIVFTINEAPTTGDTGSYYSSSDNAMAEFEVEGFFAQHTEQPIPGNWYALLSCGGGRDGNSSITEIVSTKRLRREQSAYIKDIEVPSFSANGNVYLRYPDGDTDSLYAWKTDLDLISYTDTEDIVEGQTLCYLNIDKTDSTYITAYLESSTSLHRRYELGVPEGIEGISYGIPEAFDVNKTYSYVSYEKRSYDTVLYQGGTWLYIGQEPSSGNYPPALPDTSNDYWRLLAAPGADGTDIGTGITVHKFELRKPVSTMNLFLEIMQSPTGVISDAVPFINTLTDPLSRQKVRAWNKSTGTWQYMTENGLDATYNNDPVIVDMDDNTQERFLFYRWRTPSNSSATWQSVIFPNSKPVDYLMSITPEGVIPFTVLDVTDFRYFSVSPLRYILAVVDETNKQYPVTVDMVSYDIDNDTATIDLYSIMSSRQLTTITGTWKAITNVGTTDTVIEGDHTHTNKNIIDLIGIDLLGNITIDGVVLVSAEDRNTSRYLIDPGLFPSDQEELTALLVDPNTFSISTERIDPGQYSAVKVSLYRDAGVYNSSMSSRIMSPSSYVTVVPTVDSEL